MEGGLMVISRFDCQHVIFWKESESLAWLLGCTGSTEYKRRLGGDKHLTWDARMHLRVAENGATSWTWRYGVRVGGHLTW